MMIPILPFDAMRSHCVAEPLTTHGGAGDEVTDRETHHFGPSGRWLLARFLDSLGLERCDEIAIVTTSGERYVSTCVSVTAFNTSRISRIVTDATRVVIAIHEFGYVADGFARKCAAWQRRGITVIEDCAHVMGLSTADGPVGSFGDAALYSFPKLLPVARGGLLRTTRTLGERRLSPEQKLWRDEGEAGFAQYLPALGELNRRRRARHELIRGKLSGVGATVEFSATRNPWMTVLQLTPDVVDGIRRRVRSVEFGATLRDDWLLIPTNPLVREATFEELCATIAALAGPATSEDLRRTPVS